MTKNVEKMAVLNELERLNSASRVPQMVNALMKTPGSDPYRESDNCKFFFLYTVYAYIWSYAVLPPQN